MQKKMTIKEYIELEYTAASKPHPSTIIRRIERGALQGVYEGKWYVLKDVGTGNVKADEIINRHASS